MKKGMIIAILLSAVLLAGCAPSAQISGEAAAPVMPSAQISGTLTSTAPSAQDTQEAESPAAAWRQVAPEDALVLLDVPGVVLLDVRTQEEFDAGHIEGAQLLPYDEIAMRVDELPADKDATIVVYCRSGRRSAIAAEALAGMGYTSVYDLGGIQSWPYDIVTVG